MLEEVTFLEGTFWWVILADVCDEGGGDDEVDDDDETGAGNDEAAHDVVRANRASMLKDFLVSDFVIVACRSEIHTIGKSLLVTFADILLCTDNSLS